MRNIYCVLLVLFAMSGICSSCSSSDEKHEYTELEDNLNFGKGTYRPNPFKFLDSIPPFLWMGMPDSVKKEMELQVSFNEDAIRSHSSAQLAFADANGDIVDGIIVGKLGTDYMTFNADSSMVTIPVTYIVNPTIGDSILYGSVVVLGNELDQVNDATLSSTFTPVASWQLAHKIGINWWRWIILILIVILTLYLIYIIACLIYGAIVAGMEALSGLSTPPLKVSFKKGTHNGKHSKHRNKKQKKGDDRQDDEQGEYGRYALEIAPSIYKINRNYIIPSGSQHKNPSGKTCGQILNALNDADGVIKFKHGEPIFDKDGGTMNGEPLQASFPEGIDQFLNPTELQNGVKINRNKLHDETFRRIAKSYGIDEDELQVFKGNSAPVSKLMEKYNCSEQAVYNRCRNPYRLARVLHECKDGKTVQLVPWVYHHIPHSGGIEAVASKYR